MPKRPKPRLAPRISVQLPLFEEAASLIRVRPERNEWRFYRMEIWPDLLGRALLLRQWGRIGTEGSPPAGSAPRPGGRHQCARPPCRAEAPPRLPVMTTSQVRKL